MRPGETIYIELVVDGDAAEQTVDTGKAMLEKLRAALGDLLKDVNKLVEDTDLTPLVKQTVNLTHHVSKCENQVAYLRTNLGKLKNAVLDAASPLGAALLPAINRAVRDMTAMTQQVGAVLSVLVDTVTVTDAAARSADRAAGAQQRYTGAIHATRRSLAGFDKLNRLNAASGSSTTVTQTETEVVLSPKFQAALEKINRLLQPLLEINLNPLKAALSELADSFGPVWETLGQLLEWVWYELLTPFLSWVTEELAPKLLYGLSFALEAVVQVLEPVMEGLRLLWAALKPLVSFIGERVVGVVVEWSLAFADLASTVGEKSQQLTRVFEDIALAVYALWTAAEPVLDTLATAAHRAFGEFGQAASQAFDYLVSGLGYMAEFLLGAFTGNWENAWQGMKNMLKSAINGMISLLNGLLRGIADTVNSMVRLINSVEFSFPSWMPGVGGKSYHWDLSTVSAPQIPYLAQGAVLPANRPFLAVVGDQKHGTNVEAPLATIQQAVAQVTAGQNTAMLAALQASVEVQQEILSAVLGIRIGDDVLARAVDRYNRKMAVVYGTGKF